MTTLTRYSEHASFHSERSKESKVLGTSTHRASNLTHKHYCSTLNYTTCIVSPSPSEHTRPNEANSGDLENKSLDHSQNVSYSQGVSCLTSREAATSPRIARPTRLMGTGKNNASGHSQTVSYSQGVSCHSSREAATSPRIARPSSLMDKERNNASYHSQTVSHSQNVSCHSSKEAATSPRITRQLVSQAPGDLCMTYITAGHSERASCHSERSEQLS